jgi:hypothetical protein
MNARGKLSIPRQQLKEQTRPIQMLSRLRALFLPGRAGAGAGLENLVQVAESGSSRQL